MAWLVRAFPLEEGVKLRKGEEPEIQLQRLMPADALRIRGRHNAANALAALALASAIGCRWRRCCTRCATTAASRTASSRWP